MNYDPAKTLLVDGGALLFARRQAESEIKTRQDRILARAIVQSYNEMGYDAVGISSYDLSGGLNFLFEMSELADFPWLSANIFDETGKKNIFTPSLVLERNGVKIGIFALTDPSRSPSTANNIRIESWQKILPDLITELRSQCDMVILLSSLSRKTNEEISRNYPEINIIIQSATSTGNLKPVLFGNTLITQTAKQGKYLGHLQINWQKNSSWQNNKTSPLTIRFNELDRIKWQINKLKGKGNPTEIYRNRPRILEYLKKMEARKIQLTSEIDRLRTEEGPDNYKSTWQDNFIAMEAAIDNDPAVDQLVQKAKHQVNEMGRQISRKKGLTGYSGHISCQECHIEEYRNWADTRHAGAFATLTKKAQQYNVSCLPCHVTGISDHNRNMALTLTHELQNVGCEACHGPGLRHAGNPRSFPMDRKIDRETCLKCHNREHDDSFEFEYDISKAH